MELIKLGEQEIILDTKHLEFSESNIMGYMAEFGGIYNYYAQRTADAEALLEKAERYHESKYLEKFQQAKELGGSDKMAEAKARTDEEVQKLNDFVINIHGSVLKLKAFVKSLDKAHENAQNLGHFLRKEMDKLMSSWPSEKPESDFNKILNEMKK